MKKQLTIISASLLLAFTPAQAGLRDALDSMFMSAGTNPQVINGQMRGAVVGGSFAARAPIRNINLVTFDPPRFSAGCGGIDLFGGSFSFINSDQLVALFRQVAANAVGLAFKAALDQINPSLGKLMQDFQSKIQALNENMRNTCAIANQIVKTATDPSARKELADNASTAAESAKGFFSDMFDGVSKLFSSPNQAPDNANSSGNPDVGNVTWKALWNGRAAELFGNPATGETDSNFARELLMSLIGYEILGGSADARTTLPNGKQAPDVGGLGPRVLTLHELVEGGYAGQLKYYQCNSYDPNGCTTVNPRDLTSFHGIKGQVKVMMYGGPTNSSANYTSGSIVGLLADGCSGSSVGNPCGFTSSQMAFLSSMSSPLLGYMRRVQHSKHGVTMMAGLLEDPIINEYALAYGEGALKAARKVYLGGKYRVHTGFEDSVKALDAELAHYRDEQKKLPAKMQQAFALTETIIKSTPGLEVVNK